MRNKNSFREYWKDMWKCETPGEKLARRIATFLFGFLMFCKGTDCYLKKQAERREFLEKKGVAQYDLLVEDYDSKELETLRNLINNKYSLTPIDEFSGNNEEAYRGLIYDPKTKAWNSPKPGETNINFVQPGDSTSKTNPITEAFIERIIEKESKGNPNATSRKGARGLMQIMEPTWTEVTPSIYGEVLDFRKAYDPTINRRVGEEYLKRIDKLLTNNLPGYSKMPAHKKQRYLEAAYNGGPNRLIRLKGNLSKMPRETRNYIR